MSRNELVAKTLRLPAWVWAEIERYRERTGAVTLADAVRRLLIDALRAEKRRQVTGDRPYRDAADELRRVEQAARRVVEMLPHGPDRYELTEALDARAAIKASPPAARDGA